MSFVLESVTSDIKSQSSRQATAISTQSHLRTRVVMNPIEHNRIKMEQLVAVNIVQVMKSDTNYIDKQEFAELLLNNACCISKISRNTHFLSKLDIFGKKGVPDLELIDKWRNRSSHYLNIKYNIGFKSLDEKEELQEILEKGDDNCDDIWRIVKDVALKLAFKDNIKIENDKLVKRKTKYRVSYFDKLYTSYFSGAEFCVISSARVGKKTPAMLRYKNVKLSKQPIASMKKWNATSIEQRNMWRKVIQEKRVDHIEIIRLCKSLNDEDRSEGSYLQRAWKEMCL